MFERPVVNSSRVRDAVRWLLAVVVVAVLALVWLAWPYNLRSAHLWFIISEFPAACNFSDRRPSPCQAGSESGVATWRARS
ncbi:hypothetical protein SAMN05444166_7677 [Singulisphaera sp. GP187]|nr:hypothetical protein SAMN05444166_7677 [Singulisphaera sp. GP187]